MTYLSKLTLTTLLASAATVTFAQSPPDTMEAHAARARELAAGGHAGALQQCTRATASAPAGPPAAPEGAPPRQAAPAAEAAQVFDNLYYVGTSGVAAWAVKTSQGIILIDALNNGKEAAEYIEPGLRKFGLNPADIKYLVITHGHGDHYGGAQYLVDKYKVRVALSDADWKQFESGNLQFNSPNWDKPPKRDMTVTTGQKLTLGDTTVEFHVGPGHTLGTVSMIIPVKDRGVSHVAALFGGVGFNFPGTLERYGQFSDSALSFAALARSRGADVLLTNHPAQSDTFPKVAALKARRSGQPHPFVTGGDSVGRFLGVLSECALAGRARVAAATR